MPTVSLAEALSALRYTGAIKMSVRSKATEIITWLYRDYGNYTTHMWGYDPNVNNPEHHSGYAIDFMVFTNKTMGDRIYAYLVANHARLGIKHVIWYQTITSWEIQPGVRRQMDTRGNGNATDNHRDHLHIMFYATAYKAPTPAGSAIPSVGAKKVPAALSLTTGRDKLFYRMLQAYLNYSIKTNLVVDGDFGPATTRAMEKWLGDKVVNGSLDLAAVKKLQGVVGTKPDGDWGPNTTRAFKVWLNNHRTLLRY